MKKAIIIIISLVILAGAGFLIYKFWPDKKNEEAAVEGEESEYSQIIIGSKEIKAEVVKNEQDRMKGLSGRDNLANSEGMLFVFEKSDIYPFWMKDMKFAIDIIWIKDKKIVDLVKDAEPPTTAKRTITYTPRAEADLVLEVSAGFCALNNVKIGDSIGIKN